MQPMVRWKRTRRQSFLKIVSTQNRRKKCLETCVQLPCLSNRKGSVSWLLYVATRLTSSNRNSLNIVLEATKQIFVCRGMIPLYIHTKK